MSWNASDPSFNLETFFNHLRATKPPYKCPYEECKGKVYRSFSGIQSHVDSVHPPTRNHDDHASDTDDRDEISKNESACCSSAPSGHQASQRGTYTWAQAQKQVEIDIDGRFRPLNIMEPLEIIHVRDADLPPEQRSDAVLRKYSELMALSPSGKPPEAQFTVVEDYKPKEAKPMPSSYIRHVEKSPEELEEMVEYDMDEEDYEWLDIMNKRRATAKLGPVSESNFEYLMDRLEKESHFQHIQVGLNKQMGAVVDEDALCCVCLDGECHNSNAILFCDMCNIAVHQECYGVPYIPEGQWLCRRCQLSPSQAVDCVLCPNRGGAFKQTSEGKWAHVVCAIWVPEVHFANTVFLEPIEGLPTVPTARWKLKCIVCKQKGVGACTQCYKASCYTAFHVTCAQQAGMFMRVEPSSDKSPGGNNYNVRKYVYCDIHAPGEGEDLHKVEQVPKTPKRDHKSVAARKEMSKKKIRIARRKLAENRNSAPSVSIPVLPGERLDSIQKNLKFAGKASFLPRLVAYWTLKRESRFGVPLLRRLQVHYQSRNLGGGASEALGSCDKEMKLKFDQWKMMRQNLEKVRILCELTRKRERNKKDYVSVAQEILDSVLKPPTSVLSEVVSRLCVKDRLAVFAKPVTERDVPGYSHIIKKPMDLETMSSKAANSQYKTFTELESDFKLMIENCLKFNADNEYFWKYGMRMKRIGQKVLCWGRKEFDRCQRTVSNKQLTPVLKQALSVTLINEAQLKKEKDRYVQISRQDNKGKANGKMNREE